MWAIIGNFDIVIPHIVIWVSIMYGCSYRYTLSRMECINNGLSGQNAQRWLSIRACWFVACVKLMSFRGHVELGKYQWEILMAANVKSYRGARYNK